MKILSKEYYSSDISHEATAKIVNLCRTSADIRKSYMKRIYLSCIFFILLSSVHALEGDLFAGNQIIQDSIIAQIKTVREPVVFGDYVIFTADAHARHTGIAFDFENYRRVHSFRRLVKPNLEADSAPNLLFYVLKIPQNLTSIKYRLVIDGLWTTDPHNTNAEFAKNANVNVSKVLIDRPIEKRTGAAQAAGIATLNGDITPGAVRFVYEGESGQRIRLGGTFTNWDSFIYELQETSPGLYQLELSLPKGTYYYAFYKGMSAFADDKNPKKVYTADGRIASVISID